MRAVIQDRYGSADVVVVGELPDPVPADDEVLIAVRATSLNGSDRDQHLVVRRDGVGQLTDHHDVRAPVPVLDDGPHRASCSSGPAPPT